MVNELSNGVMVLAADAARVMALLEDDGVDFRHKRVNERWTALLLADGWLRLGDTREVLDGVSQAAPLLYVWNAGEHGWGYRLFDRGCQRAAVSVSHEPSCSRVATANPATLRVFDIDEDSVTRLERLLSAGSVRCDTQGQVGEFKALMGFPEFAWMSYEYLEEE